MAAHGASLLAERVARHLLELRGTWADRGHQDVAKRAATDADTTAIVAVLEKIASDCDVDARTQLAAMGPAALAAIAGVDLWV